MVIMRAAALLVLIASTASAQILDDRGPGVATSMFGTYIERGQWLIYPFVEYYRDDDLEYAPSELGAAGDTDFEGRYRAKEALIFFAYGLTEDLAVEFEAAFIDATFEKSPLDLSALPAKINESGLGDIEGQIRWRWRRGTAESPEFFSFAEVVLPHAKEKVLIGTPGLQVKVGTGVIRGFRWGTMSARAAIEYDQESTSQFDAGEFAVEYLKRLSPRTRVYVGIEGVQDEIELIAELQWQLRPGVILKLNNGFGLTAKATDWAPEVGILFTFPAGGR